MSSDVELTCIVHVGGPQCELISCLKSRLGARTWCQISPSLGPSASATDYSLTPISNLQISTTDDYLHDLLLKNVDLRHESYILTKRRFSDLS